MRRELLDVTTKKHAAMLAPWAVVIQKIYCGYMCFESVVDYATWLTQV